ncbi:MAG: hypothetical protein QOF62_3781 [Pyrinomonadaceae bacterium]|jgi:hypothetical protein|nr:hypothetical protein [Pyrinomonadaceae bacterium]
MIPQRTPLADFAGSELRERVTACRKRLRNNRFTKATIGRELDQGFSVPKATFLDDESAMRESLSSIELSSAAQEVGIT